MTLTLTYLDYKASKSTSTHLEIAALLTKAYVNFLKRNILFETNPNSTGQFLSLRNVTCRRTMNLKSLLYQIKGNKLLIPTLGCFPSDMLFHLL